eukprot:CAMPEP_0185193600 /NCGR_PEP_ID=MMETSP1140-20130426/26866_1 /TAXON_ID=298111 /ORGANISM="Pavlova sp., Strain CCMP459" /LENGTH=44 /DNA_ID= /DNA_START= /DNA_END= /DNA_ORIENTATION=
MMPCMRQDESGSEDAVRALPARGIHGHGRGEAVVTICAAGPASG